MLPCLLGWVHGQHPAGASMVARGEGQGWHLEQRHSQEKKLYGV